MYSKHYYFHRLPQRSKQIDKTSCNSNNSGFSVTEKFQYLNLLKNTSPYAKNCAASIMRNILSAFQCLITPERISPLFPTVLWRLSKASDRLCIIPESTWFPLQVSYTLRTPAILSKPTSSCAHSLWPFHSDCALLKWPPSDHVTLSPELRAVASGSNQKSNPLKNNSAFSAPPLTHCGMARLLETCQSLLQPLYPLLFYFTIATIHHRLFCRH